MIINLFCSRFTEVTGEAIAYFTLCTCNSIASFYSLGENFAIWTKSEPLGFKFCLIVFVLINFMLLILSTTVSIMVVIAAIDAENILTPPAFVFMFTLYPGINDSFLANCYFFIFSENKIIWFVLDFLLYYFLFNQLVRFINFVEYKHAWTD